MYNSEIQEQYRQYKKARLANKKVKERVAELRKSLGGIPRSGITRDAIWEHAFLSHFRQTSDANVVYSCDVSVIQGLELSSNSDYKRLAALDSMTSMGIQGEADESHGCYESNTHIYFSMVRKTYSHSRLINIPPAAAFKFGPDDMGVVLHRHMVSWGDDS
eukprot:5595435-Pyramimonas_sp.AAC.2